MIEELVELVQGALQASFQVLQDPGGIPGAPGGIPVLMAFQVLQAVLQVGGAPGGIAAGDFPCYAFPVLQASFRDNKGLLKRSHLKFWIPMNSKNKPFEN